MASGPNRAPLRKLVAVSNGTPITAASTSSHGSSTCGSRCSAGRRSRLGAESGASSPWTATVSSTTSPMTDTASTSAIGAARLVESLERLGVELVFGLPGVHNLPIWKALSESDIRLVGVRHEQTAVYAADGYARTTGRLGVAVVTTGPGAANTLGATGEAMAAGSPVLVIATDIATGLRREGVYGGTLHETRDQTAMFVPVTKAARMLADAEEIAGAALDCGRNALSAPTGPVYLGIPTDLLSREA